MHPRARTERSLVGLVLVLLSLSAYGCGDTGTSTQPAELGGLSVSPGSLQPSFNPATTSYTATVSSKVSSTIITASPRVAGDTIRIENQQITSLTIPLDAPGAEKSINIVVTDTGTGGTSKSYTVRVVREKENTTLAALSVSPGTLAPSTFDKERPDYTVNGIGNTVTSITISATKSDENTVMQIGSVTVPAGVTSGQANVRLGGTGSETEVRIVMTAQDRSERVYKITIKRGPSDNSFLRSLVISSGSTNFSLSPRFSQTASDYTVHVANNIGSVSVTPSLDDDTASMTVNGSSATSGQAQLITLNQAGQDTPIIIFVTAQKNDAAPRRYSVNIKREALGGNNNLQSLAVSQGSLDTGFDPKDEQYNVSLLSSVTSVRITADPQDGTARVTINGKSSPTDIDLGAPGPRTQITTSIIVTAQNNDTKTYNVTFDRAALGGNFNLQSLTVTGQTLSPTFSQSTTRYTLEVDNSVGSITVNAAPQDNRASVSLLVGNVQKTNPISLPAGPSTTEIEIEVTAQNGSPKSYFITVTRKAPSSNNNLSALTVTAGSVNHPVDLSTPPYTASVAAGVGTVTVTATLEDTTATLEINGQGTSSGVASAPITLGPDGSDTGVPVVVIAVNGDRKEYPLTVRKAAAAPTPPAKPATAPDLIPEDDSCLTIPSTGACDPNSGSTRTDDITAVKQPRFKIATPTDEETPHLYIDGQKDTDAEYNKTDKTLKPSKELSDAKYKITNTVSRGDAESPQSDLLEVTINSSGLVNPGKK